MCDLGGTVPADPGRNAVPARGGTDCASETIAINPIIRIPKIINERRGTFLNET